ncbi:MAG: metal ABC transporter permease [Cardiobacteriaceae bacterium]|nr:metal ABC transporter permease [Cardiobacteriaceae bacterium]
MIAWLLEPLQYQYMQKALLAASVIGGVCALLSVYLMLKGWSLVGDALSHAVVPGVAAAYALALPYAVGAFFAGTLAMFAMLALRRLPMLRQDAVIGVVFTTFFAAGLLLISLNPTAVNLDAVIYGQILAIADRDLAQMLLIAALTLAVLALQWKSFMLLFFDEVQARIGGLPVRRLQGLFFALVSLAVVAALQAVGAILVIALLIAPGATAFLLAQRFGQVLLIALAIGTTSSIAGVYLSYHLDLIPGAMIVLLQSALFLATFLHNHWRKARA